MWQAGQWGQAVGGVGQAAGGSCGQRGVAGPLQLFWIEYLTVKCAMVM